MRNGQQQKRMRGRNRNRGHNPLTRVYESNGPDVKVRGTAHHIAEKYVQLARDAQSSGDPVTAEGYTSREQFPSNIAADAFNFPSRTATVIAPGQRTQMETAPAVRF